MIGCCSTMLRFAVRQRAPADPRRSACWRGVESLSGEARGLGCGELDAVVRPRWDAGGDPQFRGRPAPVIAGASSCAAGATSRAEHVARAWSARGAAGPGGAPLGRSRYSAASAEDEARPWHRFKIEICVLGLPRGQLRHPGRQAAVCWGTRPPVVLTGRSCKRSAFEKPTMTEPTLGIIGGSGLYDLEGLWRMPASEVRLTTPFGEPSDAMVTGTLHGVLDGVLAAPRPRPPRCRRASCRSGPISTP